MRKVCSFIIACIGSFGVHAQQLYFPPLTGNTWDTMSPQSLNWCQDNIDSLYNFLDTNNTKAFILLKDGKIVLEKYFGTHTQATPWQWASAGKTITSFMTGIAQQEGYLSIGDTTSDYLGQGWTSCTPLQEEQITIRHQLTMTSGLDDGVTDPYCTLNTCLLYEADAGTRWAYHNGPYTLLDSVIENTTGVSLNSYTTQKLKNPTGMTGTFLPVGYNNVFFSNARSMARFGLLILNGGNWDGTQVMTDTTYFNQMVNTSQQLNLSYGYLWWLNGKTSFMVPGLQTVFNGPLCPNAPADMIAAMGKDGQFVDVIKSQNMVWVRMGEAPDSTLPVPFLLNDKIWEYINLLPCNSTGMSEGKNSNNDQIQVFPNPATDRVTIVSSNTIVNSEIHSMYGQLLKRTETKGKELSISIADLPPGQYIIKVNLHNGFSKTLKLVTK
jgi:CubicO group peptidase (beta-lactamase class C family)